MKSLISLIIISTSSIFLFACASGIDETNSNNEYISIESMIEDSFTELEADLEKTNNFKAYKSDIIKNLRTTYQISSSSSNVDSKLVAERISNLTEKPKSPWRILSGVVDTTTTTGFSNTKTLCWTLCDLKQMNENHCGVNPIVCLNAANQHRDMVSFWFASSAYRPPRILPFTDQDMIYSKSTVTPLAFVGFMRFHQK